ncbi:MAG: AraC family transcriptional regulator, partial [Salinisphaeraceae bacterium]|nr:AraC family transcriptional regulator [Salinisphaeraceae bacterium]
VDKWGVSESDMLAGTRISPNLLRNPDARIPPGQAAIFGMNMLRLSGKPGIGFELGLHLKLTTHGKLGYALLSVNTLRDAAEIAINYAQTRFAAIQLELEEEEEKIALYIHERYPLGPFQSIVNEAILTLLWRHACTTTGVDQRDCEFFFPWAEPDYFVEYRERLPQVHWSQPASLIRFPKRYLDLRMTLADPVAANRALSEVEQEIASLGDSPLHIVERVRKELKTGPNGFPKLEAVAQRLHTSERSLKRKLKTAGTSYRELLAKAMLEEAKRLMLNPDLDLQQISTLLGYQDPATFTHAFRRWTGQSPSQYRANL